MQSVVKGVASCACGTRKRGGRATPGDLNHLATNFTNLHELSVVDSIRVDLCDSWLASFMSDMKSKSCSRRRPEKGRTGVPPGRTVRPVLL